MVNELIHNRKCPERSVHFGKRKRFEKAQEQLKAPAVKIDDIIQWTNEFISLYGIDKYDGDNFIEICNDNIDIAKFNKNTMHNYEGITSCNDLVWMKFAKDKNKQLYLGVVACSNDVNFDIPPKSEDYDIPGRIVNGKIKTWKYNTSGILIHSCDLEWEKSFILAFPLLGLKMGREGTRQRHDIETGIGNYLIMNNVPIIDYYSHKL